MTHHYTIEELRDIVQRARRGALRLATVELLEDLLAARERLRELEQGRHRFSDEELRSIRGQPGTLDRDIVNDMAVELLAARERLRELEPRPLLKGDLFETPMGNIFTAPQPGYLAAHRIVRVPIPSAAAPPAEEREDVAPNTDPAKCAWNTDGYWCHAGTCKVCDDRYDAGERSGWAKPLPAEPAEKDVRDRNGVSFNYHYKSQPATGFDVEKIPAELRALRDEVAEIKAKIGGCT